MKSFNKTILMLIITTALVSNNAFAEQFDVALFDNQQLDLERIEVTAVRSDNAEQSLRDIELIDEQQLAEQQPLSVPQAVNYIPNVTAVGGPRDSVQSVNIRGLQDDRVLQLVDGVRQNFESGHRPTYFLDPALLKNVEVIKGPVSSLWGSGALGGVVSANTISASDLLTDKDWGGFIKAGYNTNDNKKATTLATAYRFGSVDMLLSGYYSDQNNLELGNGTDLEGSGHEDNGLMTKIDWYLDDAQIITFNLRDSEVKGHVPSNGAASLESSSVFLLDRNSDTQSASMDYRLNPENKLVDAQALFSWNKNDVEESRLSDDRFDTTKIETLALNINNRSQFDKFAILYGFDGYQDELEATRGGSNRPTIPEATTDVWGAFAQFEVSLAEDWAFNLGARYDYFSTEADNLNQDRSDNELSPSVALKWQTTDNLAVTLRYDEAFRAPTSAELYSTGTHFCYGPGQGCNSFVANPDLDAEKAKNTELLISYKLANAFAKGDSLTLQGSVFHNDVDNFIEQSVNTTFNFMTFMVEGTTTNANVDEAELEGFELAANYNFNDFEAILSYGQTRGKDKNTDEYLSDIPADKWVLDLSQVLMQGKVKVGMRGIFAQSQDHKPDDNTNSYDSYNVADVYARWQPTNQLTLDLSVNNVTDKYYRVAFEELYRQGRDVRLAMTYDF